MNRLTESFRVKVFVDGKWVSTGDFHDLQCATDHARKLALYLGRRVEIRDANGGLVANGAVKFAGEGDQTFVSDEESAHSTVELD